MLAEQKQRDRDELAVLEQGLGVRIEGVDRACLSLLLLSLGPVRTPLHRRGIYGSRKGNYGACRRGRLPMSER